MKKLYTFSTLILMSAAAFAQTTFWTENFGTGCNLGQAPSAYTGTNGTWSEANTGTNDASANKWFVSATASGTGVGNCSNNCLVAFVNDQSLHIGNPPVVIPNIISIGQDTGSTYLTGVYCSLGICSVTNKRAMSPLINCTGSSNITCTFLYYEGSEAADDATFVYSADGGTTWTTIDPIAKTPTTCTAPGGNWTSLTVTLPASANNNANVKIGFNWTNNASGGTDPSFAVDNITLTSNPLGIPQIDLSTVKAFYANGVINVSSDYNWSLLSVYDILGSTVTTQRDGNQISLQNASSGVYFVSMLINGERVTRKVVVQ